MTRFGHPRELLAHLGLVPSEFRLALRFDLSFQQAQANLQMALAAGHK